MTKPLTEAEHAVLVHIARGADNKHIARDRCCAVETVRSHVKNVLSKLGAANRAHAVAIAYHTGIFATINTRQQEKAAA